MRRALLAEGLGAMLLTATVISGAHFNPAVSFIEALRGNLSVRATIAYAIVQIIGCIAGAFLAHAMFELPIIQSSLHMRAGRAQWLSEGVATAALILVVIGSTNPREPPCSQARFARPCCYRRLTY
jgi:glycerol uptake facilitator-like aquaporin